MTRRKTNTHPVASGAGVDSTTRRRSPGLAMLLLVGMAGCTDSPTDPPVATHLTMSTATLSFSSIGHTLRLAATVTDQQGATLGDASVAWASSAASVASVSATGLVTALANGSATITASSGSARASASVTVSQVAVSMTLSPDSVVLAGPADTTTVIASVLDAGGSHIVNPHMTWSSTDEAIATVSGSGLVAGAASGSTTITVEATAGGQGVTEAIPATVESATLVDASGGELSFADDAVSLLLPAGAVSGPVFITAEPAVGLPSNPTPIPGTAFDFGPDGIAFGEAVTLTIGYDPADVPPDVPEEQLGIHRLVAGEYVQVDAGTVDAADSTVSGSIRGFSVFAIVRRLAVATATLPDGVELVDYGTATLAAVGGSGNYSWALASGPDALPTGLVLSATGEIAGTPTVPGTSEFTVVVTSGTQSARQALSITVHPTLAVTTTSLPNAARDVPYNETLVASGGDGSYSWSLAPESGLLPTGLSLTPHGELTGTPSEVDSWDFALEVSSGDGQTARRAFSIEVTLLVLEPDALCRDYPARAIATFADSNLEAAVRDDLGLDAQDELTCDLLATLTDLSAPGAGIGAMVGIQNLTGLTSLNLSGNTIAAADLDVLSGLSGLTYLNLNGDPDLSGNTVGDITALSELASLTELHLNNTENISDLGPVSGLTNLTELHVRNNSITDLGPLSGLTNLQGLNLAANPFSDVAPLAGLTDLTVLSINGSLTAGDGIRGSVTDISALSGMSRLTILWIADNPITDISALAGMPSLRNLLAFESLITDVSALRALANLTLVSLQYNPELADIQPLLDNPGLGAGDRVHVGHTAVSCGDVDALRAKGVAVVIDSCPSP